MERMSSDARRDSRVFEDKVYSVRFAFGCACLALFGMFDAQHADVVRVPRRHERLTDFGAQTGVSCADSTMTLTWVRVRTMAMRYRWEESYRILHSAEP